MQYDLTILNMHIFNFKTVRKPINSRLASETNKWNNSVEVVQAVQAKHFNNVKLWVYFTGNEVIGFLD